MRKRRGNGLMEIDTQINPLFLTIINFIRRGRGDIDFSYYTIYPEVD